MKLLRITKELRVVSENQNENTDKVEYPLYEEEYKSGLRIIFKQAIERDEIKEKNRIFLNERKNILTFIGKRGAGKTTAMDEFCRILKDMTEERLKYWISRVMDEEEQKKLEGKRFKFNILDPIDASLLEDKEDLFELIMASIYRGCMEKIEQNKGNNYWENRDIGQIAEQFQEIFRMYYVIRGEQKKTEGNSIAAMIQYMAGSQGLQQKIANLIDKLFEMISDRDEQCRCEYIVIAIDDLDLNLRHGYEMLEQLQKYFSYYKIIIVLAIDYEQMGCVCEEHFFREMRNTTDKDDEQKRNRKMANDYMTKIFHFAQRMYMPDTKKLTKNTYVEVEKLSSDLSGKNMGSERIIGTKQFLMAKIAECMDIYYDACGLKKHFCEANTIRELVSYNEFLESLIPIPYEKLILKENLKEKKEIQSNIEILQNYDENHERFQEDITERLAQNMLMPYQKTFFEELISHDLERHAMYFVNVNRKKDELEVILDEYEMGDINEQEYTYGDMLEKINKMGRNCYEDKPFVSCVMAAFTSEMVREYLHYCYNPDDKRRKKYKRRLVKFMGNSIGNVWTGEIVPKVIIKVNGADVVENYGYINAQTSLLSIKINIERLKEIREKELEGESLIKAIKEWMVEEEVITTLEYIDLFAVRREGESYKGVTYKFILNRLVTDGKGEEVVDGDAPRVPLNKEELKILGVGGDIVIDMLGFVAKSFNYEEESERLRNNILDGLGEFLMDYFGLERDRKIFYNALKKMVEELSLYRKIRGKKQVSKVSLPFYNLDMTYNIIKRLRRAHCQEFVIEEEFPDKILQSYKDLGRLLAEETGFYQDYTVPDYSTAYNNCPYIDAMNRFGNGEYKKSKVRLMENLRSMATSKTVLKATKGRIEIAGQAEEVMRNSNGASV